jgi:hypothetical protein
MIASQTQQEIEECLSRTNAEIASVLDEIASMVSGDESPGRDDASSDALKAKLASVGDSLAAKRGYEGLSGMDAVYRYLIDTYHWLPSDVRALSLRDLEMLLAGVDRAPTARPRKTGRRSG